MHILNKIVLTKTESYMVISGIDRVVRSLFLTSVTLQWFFWDFICYIYIIKVQHKVFTGMCDVLQYMFTFNLDISLHYVFKACVILFMQITFTYLHVTQKDFPEDGQKYLF